MGSSCCHAESPCSSVEERSGLLKDDSKATMPTGRTIVVDTNGPEGDDDLRITPDVAIMKVEVKAEAVPVKKCPEVRETEPNNTQENGPLKDAAPSPRKGSELKENITRAQDEDTKDCPANTEQVGPLQCTFNTLQKEHAAADLTATNTALADESPALTPEKIPDISSTTAEVVCLEDHTETKATMEQDMLASHDHDEEAGSKLDSVVAEESGQFPDDDDGILSLPNSQLTVAVCQLSCSSVVSQEIDKVSLSCIVTEDSENRTSSVCKDSGPELLKSQEICDSSSSGSEPAGLDHCGEDQDSAYCVRDPETTVLKDAIKSSESSLDACSTLACANLEEVASLEDIEQDIGEEEVLKGQVKDGDVLKTRANGELLEEEEEEEEEVVKKAPTEARSQAGKDAEVEELTGKEEQPAGSSSYGVTADEVSLPKKEASAEEGLGNSEEDLYRGAEELSASHENTTGPLPTILKVEDRCSLDPPMDILSYSEREWKGNTAKSALIRKGYKEMSQRFGSLRRVRGDNYCALRATLFQVLAHSTTLPVWLQEEDITMLPEQLEAQEGLISQWTFPGECMQGDGTGDATLQLKGYMELLRNKWQAAADCSSAAERQQLCERVFQGGEEELGLLEALKLLMLGRAVELHGCMQAGGDVPLFCWLLFARDSSECPRSFLSNHLSHVGLIAGLEQVEMFLLGYALHCTIQVYRLYKADTEEFVTYYPDDHKDDWPSVCLVTEDDRHYNVPVVEAEEHKELNTS